MQHLSTPLSVQECLSRLREQIQPLTLFSRMNIFGSPTSQVLGRVSHHTITLESSRDRFSKRLVGTLRPAHDGTLIEYAWEAGPGHKLFGDACFDEDEILSFLSEWLEARKD